MNRSTIYFDIFFNKLNGIFFNKLNGMKYINKNKTIKKFNCHTC